MAKIEKKYCGIDVSKKSFTCSLEMDNKCKTNDYSYNEASMEELLMKLPADVHCIIEATGSYHCRLAYFLYGNGIEVSVVNPLSVKRFAQSLMLRTKTDKADSKMLIEYGKRNTPEPWHPKEEYCIEIQQLLKIESRLIRQQTALLNQQEAIEHSVVVSEFAREVLQQELEENRRLQKKVEKEMYRLINTNQKESFNNLKSIPGIGNKTAIVLIALTQNMEHFESYREVCSYFGLCPRIYDSGTSVKGKAKICKMGMAEIRRLLYMCALSAKRCNKGCRILYERLIAKGKAKKIALIAVANKLIRQAFSIIKNNNPYNEDFYENKFAS